MPDLEYTPYPNQITVYEVNSPYFYRNDPVLSTSEIDDLPPLAASDNWQDRIRAEVLRQASRVSMPNQFPALYETPESPRQSIIKRKRAPWVISPDIDMLNELLPLYQELWDSYTAQWGPSSRRVFAVGRLDQLPARGVYLPGTTPGQVIANTLEVHHNMRATAPKHLLTYEY